MSIGFQGWEQRKEALGSCLLPCVFGVAQEETVAIVLWEFPPLQSLYVGFEYCGRFRDCGRVLRRSDVGVSSLAHRRRRKWSPMSGTLHFFACICGQYPARLQWSMMLLVDR